VLLQYNQPRNYMQAPVKRVPAATGISDLLLVHCFVIMLSGFDTCLLVAADSFSPIKLLVQSGTSAASHERVQQTSLILKGVLSTRQLMSRSLPLPVLAGLCTAGLPL